MPKTRSSEIAKVANIAMARGSRPGERRGGRQKGTPNKSTALKKAALAAASADPGYYPAPILARRDEGSASSYGFANKGCSGGGADGARETGNRLVGGRAG